MADKILVTYSSCTDFTVGVAEAISQTLAKSGFQVDLCLMKNDSDLSQYKVMVAGSSIQDKQWLPEAMQFVQAHRETLFKKPFAAFLVCMTLAMKDADNYCQSVTEWLNPVRMIIKPVSEDFFAEGLDIDKILKFSNRICLQ